MDNNWIVIVKKVFFPIIPISLFLTVLTDRFWKTKTICRAKRPFVYPIPDVLGEDDAEALVRVSAKKQEMTLKTHRMASRRQKSKGSPRQFTGYITIHERPQNRRHCGNVSRTRVMDSTKTAAYTTTTTTRQLSSDNCAG